MRVYALVTSFQVRFASAMRPVTAHPLQLLAAPLFECLQPLTVYFYRSGFCRFSASRYNSDPAEIANFFVHLTNV
jgi:hypothetical protein